MICFHFCSSIKWNFTKVSFINISYIIYLIIARVDSQQFMMLVILYYNSPCLRFIEHFGGNYSNSKY